MRLKEMMCHDVGGISPDASLVDAIRQLEKRGGEPLPVYDQGRLVGVLTEHDVVGFHTKANGDVRSSKVRDAMTADIPAVYEDDDIDAALDKMRSRHLDGTVVLQHQSRQPVGTVTTGDLARSAPRPAGGNGHAHPDHESPPPARVFLQPIAAPSILGLYGFAGATFIVASNMAGWYGNSNSALFLFPFAAFFGGLAQFLAGMWAYRARDGIATAMHGTWGSFWMGYGLLYLLFSLHVLNEPAPVFAELGFWFIALAAITCMGAIAALAENIVLFGVLGTLGAGCIVAAVAFIGGDPNVKIAAGWVFVAAAIIAWYLATAMMFEGAFRRVILPLGAYKRNANVPGARRTHAIQYEMGQPGVRAGQ